MKLYNDAAYCENRVSGCIIRLTNGTPVYVRGRMDGSKWLVSKLETGRDMEVDYNDLDLEPVPLGFINSSALTYLTRTPMREDWRQGLRSNNARTLLGLHFSELPGKDLANTILGKYPSFQEALASNKDLAFHRHFAILKDKSILHRTCVVGKVNKDGQFILEDKYSFLDQKLGRAILENYS